MSDILFVLMMTTVCGGVGLILAWTLLRLFGDEPLPPSERLSYFTDVDPSTHCPRCCHRFNDWFIWSTGRRYCYLCWVDSDYQIVIEEVV